MRMLAFLILVAAAAAPAAAQSWTGINSEPTTSHVSRGADVYRQVDRADRSIHAGRKNGQLSHAEARRLRRTGAAIEAMADRYAADGISAGGARARHARQTFQPLGILRSPDRLDCGEPRLTAMPISRWSPASG